MILCCHSLIGMDAGVGLRSVAAIVSSSAHGEHQQRYQVVNFSSKQGFPLPATQLLYPTNLLLVRSVLKILESTSVRTVIL